MYLSEAPAIPDLVKEYQERGDADGLAQLLLKINAAGIKPTINGRYKHWNKLRHLSPPEGLDHRTWWVGIKFARNPLQKPLPLLNEAGEAFTYGHTEEAQAYLRLIDHKAGGALAVPELVIPDENAQRHYLMNAQMEEAIRSSQLEGATTSRRIAREMIRSGRRPRNRSEQMILNNYRALEFMRSFTGRLTPGAVLELQRILTEDTLDNPDASGRLQTPDDDRVAVFERATDDLLHKPPPAEQLPERLEALCAFANGESQISGFLHPVVRAILVHFMIGYDHPFEDGNGRTARSLFYWSMRQSGYWLTEFLSISKILREAPAQYGRAFLYTERDQSDTTYFVLYNLGVITRAIDQFERYIKKQVADLRKVEELIRTDTYNYRQLSLLSSALRSEEQEYTFKSHAKSHRVTVQSARSDLLDLKDRGLLVMRKRGREFVFSPVGDLVEKLKRGD